VGRALRCALALAQPSSTSAGRPGASCAPPDPGHSLPNLITDGKSFFMVAFAKMNSESYRVLFETRATNSSNLESKSLRIGDWFDFL
jgi:hypothetical protein